MEDKRFSLYDDSTQEQVESLKKQAGASKKYEAEHPVSAGDVVYDGVSFLITVLVAFGWMMLIQLLISFVAHQYLHMEIKTMLVVALIFAVIAAIVFIIKKSKYYIDILHREK